MNLRRINHSKVQDIPMYGGKKDTRPVKGYDIIPEPYPNIFLLGRKKSGKTSTIFHILKNKLGRNTHVTIISGSVYNDANWKNIRAFLDKNNISYDAYESVELKEGKGKGKINVLDNLVDDLNQKAEEREEEDAKKKEMEDSDKPEQRDTKDIYLDAMRVDEKKSPRKREKKEKHLTPEQIIILDDLSTELRNPSVASLIKKNRHYKSLVLISSQYLKDLTPATRQNIDVWIIFKGQEDKLLRTVHDDASVPFKFNEFKSMYNKAMTVDKPFFYVNTTYDDYRVRFDKRFE